MIDDDVELDRKLISVLSLVIVTTDSWKWSLITSSFFVNVSFIVYVDYKQTPLPTPVTTYFP